MRYFYKTVLLSIISLFICAEASAQVNYLYRYVKTTADGGDYNNTGLSWAQAKNNVQDAINDLKDYMDQHGIAEGGYVFVAKGTYKPSESTHPSSLSPQYLSFKIHAGINVWGGFYGGEVIPVNATPQIVYNAIPKSTLHDTNGDFDMNTYETVFDGNISDVQNNQAKFTWNANKQRYVTTFPSNVYHVVTFAPSISELDVNNRARSLAAEASLNVVTIKGGRAYNNDPAEIHPFNAYGGGIYMANGATIRHCRVSECEASRDGGGVYMDGGGRIEHCIITQCQALGLGVQFGHGGGVCMDQAGEIEQSYILNNSGREGGGLAMLYDDISAAGLNANQFSFMSNGFHNGLVAKYSNVCKATMVNNNTSSNEAGGIYMNGGGVLDGVTVARNRCNGTGAVINGLVSGQSAGVFANGPARIYNSVFWGGQVGENYLPTAASTYDEGIAARPSDGHDDIQYAGYAKNDDNKPYIGYSAMNNSDMVNWSSTSSQAIVSLATSNTGSDETLDYAKFIRPADRTGVVTGLKTYALGLPDTKKQAMLPGKTDAEIAYFLNALSESMYYVALYTYKPDAMSALAGSGVQLSDLQAEVGVDLSDAYLTADIMNDPYSPLCDLGCYTAQIQSATHATGINYLETNSDGANTMTLFVDPERATQITNKNVGRSWGEAIADENDSASGSAPYKHLRDALQYIWNYRLAYKAYKDSLDARAKDDSKKAPVKVYTNYAHYQIFVKEGTIYTAATRNNERIANSSIYMMDNVSIYGGFPKELTGKMPYDGEHPTTLKRNPITYPSIISGSYSDDGYENNVAHLVNFLNINNAILDGFQLQYGNASGAYIRDTEAPVRFDGGGGIVVSNCFEYSGTGLTSASEPAVMTGNKVRNCIISGCTARKGAAIYTYTLVPSRRMSVDFENCVINNNSVIYGEEQTVADNTTGDRSIILACNGADLTFNHCDVIRNVGYGINAMEGSTIEVNNSVFYANLDRPLDNTNNFDEKTAGQSGYAKLCAALYCTVNSRVTGSNNRFDYLLSNRQDDAFLAVKENHIFGDYYYYRIDGDDNLYVLTYNSGNNPDYTYPLFKNATKNAGLSVNGDITFFGGVTNWMPNSMSPLTNAGSDNTGTDITAVATRTYGGYSDIGAVENDVDQKNTTIGSVIYKKDGNDGTFEDHDLAYLNYNVYYVRNYTRVENGQTIDDLTKGGDGSSWAKAINGNALYNRQNGKLSMSDSGSSTYETEMVQSYTQHQFDSICSADSAFVTYHLYHNNKKYYIGARGQSAANLQSSLEFVFIKTGNSVYTDQTGFSMPEYYFYYYENVVADDGSSITRTPRGYLTLDPTKMSTGTFHLDAPDEATRVILSGDPKAFRVVATEKPNYSTKGITINNTGNITYADVSTNEWSYESDNTSSLYALAGYYLKTGDYYISTNYERHNSMLDQTPINQPLVINDVNQAEVFNISRTGNWNGSSETLYATRTLSAKRGMGAIIQVSGSLRNPSIASEPYYADVSTDWKITKRNNKYIFETTTSWSFGFISRSYTRYLTCNTSGDYRVTLSENSREWDVIPVYMCTSVGINGLQYAINCANAAFVNDPEHKPRQIWVGKGEYHPFEMASENNTEYIPEDNNKFAYKLLEGASLYGGFPQTGSPTMAERNPETNPTILRTPKTVAGKSQYKDPSVGRVLYQATPFTTSPTTMDGFILKNGYLNQAMKLDIDGNLENLQNTSLIKTGLSVGLMGGAGALIQSGVTLENCKIVDNACYYHSYTTDIAGSKSYLEYVSDASKYVKGNKSDSDEGDFHIAGAGVVNLGGTIKNCTIEDNELGCLRRAAVSAYAYGAGLYMSSGSVYNTVIANNSIYVKSLKNTTDVADGDIQAGAAAYLYGGSFYNNTVVNNKCNVDEDENLTVHRAVFIPGIFIYDNVTMYNTIIYGNTVTGSHPKWDTKYIIGYPVACLGGSEWQLQPDKIKATNCFIEDFSANQDNLRYGNDNGNTYPEQVWYNQKGAGNHSLCVDNGFGNPNLDATYRQTQSSTGTINAGLDLDTKGITLPDVDAAYEDRVQDCQVDIGAYEFNQALNIKPTIEDAPEDSKYNKYVTFYVTKDGGGNTSASSKENAACLDKLQRVLDGAGRYKYAYPEDYVMVKIEGYSDEVLFHPTRTSSPNQADNERSWSIMIPRGVNVYGSYDSGFKTQSITTKPTRFDGRYTVNNSSTTAYHVVTFTDRIYDPNGLPYMNTQEDKERISYDNANNRVWNGGLSTYSTGLSSSVVDESSYLSMGSKLSTYEYESKKYNDYAVLNGLILQRGNANGVSSNSSAQKVYTGYGGAAVVPSYGSIRNCIVENNSALYGGGGLFLQEGATVCGTIIKKNTAKNGGGVYFEENSSAPTWQLFSTTGGLSGTVMSFAQLVSSTIADNTATGKGGGIYFQDNARVVNSVVWNNHCGDQANVAGQTSAYRYAPNSEITFAKYPFCYTAVENNRLPGANNISVATENANGVRFLHKDHLDNTQTFATTDAEVDPNYGLSDFSQLCKVGISRLSYQLSIAYAGATQKDILGADRLFNTWEYIDMGARTIQQEQPKYTDITTILPRLYVASPKDVNTTAQQAMITCSDPIYKQKGSSFAYPFQTLDEALEYVRNLRLDNTRVVYNDGTNDHYVSEFARNIPFEIVMGKGTFYPTRDIYNVQGESYGNTYLVPEGVAIIGGFNVDELSANHFYGQEYVVRVRDHATATGSLTGFLTADTYTASDAFPIVNTNASTIAATTLKQQTGFMYTDEQMYNNLVSRRATDENDSTIQVETTGIYMRQLPLSTMKNRRAHFDNNANDLIEPWEFTNQTILSGQVINSDEADNVLHVITVVADEAIVGKRPSALLNSAFTEANTGKVSHEYGAPVELNGLQISDGQAYTWTSTCANGYIWCDYYHGGGIMVDGNWYSEAVGPVYKNSGVSQSVAYREIPLIIDRCNFSNNQGGYGGAVSSNGHIYAYNCNFASNQAIACKDPYVYYSTDGNAIEQLTKSNLSATPKTDISYPGNGGALYCTSTLNMTNCLFQNNEATIDITEFGKEPTQFKSPRSSGSSIWQYGGCGGAIYMGQYSTMNISNCNFVRNKAFAFPCIFTRNPNYFRLGAVISDINFDYDPRYNDPEYNDEETGEKYNPYHANASVLKSNPTTKVPTSYNRVYSSVFWGNQASNTDYPFTCNQVTSFCPIMPDATRQAADLSSIGYVRALMAEVGLPHSTDEVKTACGWNEHGTDAEKLAAYQKYFDTHYAQSLWFCAYEEHTGLNPRRTYDIRLTPFSLTQHPEVKIAEYVKAQYFPGKTNEQFFQKYAECKNQDYNHILSSDNDDIEGPNFTKPSQNPGLAGFQQDADWMPKRINKLTDGGWGYIKQATAAKYPNYFEDTTKRGKDNSDGVIFAYQMANATTPVYPLQYMGGGAFFTAYSIAPKKDERISIGESTYMIYEFTGDQYTTNKMRRISKMPTPTVPTLDGQLSYAYIDMGVFEYQHQRLGRPIGDVDYVWVAPQEKPENGPANGTSWMTPTSDVQRALETLLCNRNGHKKHLYMIEGTYKPIYPLTSAAGSSFESNYGFTINTENLNYVALVPDRIGGATSANPAERIVPSLTILGGFSKEVPTTMKETWGDNTYRVSGVVAADTTNKTKSVIVGDATYNTLKENEATKMYELVDYTAPEDYRNPEQYPTIFYSAEERTHSLLDIADARQWQGDANASHATLTEAPTIPITIDGVSFYNSNAPSNEAHGAAINYVDMVCPDSHSSTHGVRSAVAPTGGEPKLTLSRCKFYGNGASGATVPAITVAERGGKTLIYNSLFHSNNGTAIKAGNVMLVNNTIAKNKAGVNLTGSSEMHANVLWKNGSNYASEVTGIASDDNHYMTFNAITNININDDQEDLNHNVKLGDSNTEIIHGPNFVDPENSNIALRDFHLKPSMKLLNGVKTGAQDKGSIVYTGHPEVYYDHIIGNLAIGSPTTKYAAQFDTEEKESTYWSSEKDLSFGTRRADGYIDLGAYEYQTRVNNFVFYNPNINISGNGSTWQEAYGYGELQNAIDMVAVSLKSGAKYGYVFAKGGRNKKSTGETIVARDGVAVFGSIPTNFNALPVADGHGEVSNADIRSYALGMLSVRPGMAGPSTDRTIVTGIKSAYGNGSMSTVLDGLEVDGTVNLNTDYSDHPIKLILSNSIVHGTGTSIIHKALAYNVLFRGEDTNVTFSGDNSYGVNITSQKAIVGTEKLINSRSGVTPTSVLGYDANLEFQLSEDEVTAVSPTDYNQATESGEKVAAINSYYRLQYYDASNNLQYVDPLRFEQDRDLLGNPRKLNGAVDKGCFEAWYIDENKTAYARKVKNGNSDVYVRNYPHEGSFVYLKAGTTLNLDPSIKNCDFSVLPGYLLLREGASIYGRGNTLNATQVSVEKTVNKDGEVIAMPFAVDYSAYKDVADVYYYDGAYRSTRDNQFVTGWKRITTSTKTPASEGVRFEPHSKSADSKFLFTGKGKRMVDYAYSESGDSKDVLLTQNNVAGQTVQEDMGWNCFGSPYLVANYQTYHAYSAQDVVHYVNGTAYEVYQDSEGTKYFKVGTDSPKYYLLTDDAMEVEKTPGALTRVQSTPAAVRMNIPHYLYEYHYTGKGSIPYSDPAHSVGEYYKVASWQQYKTGVDAGGNNIMVDPFIILGEGVFTQTATFQTTESLHFAVPIYPGSTASEASEFRVMLRHTMNDGSEEEAEEEMEEELGAQEIRIYVKNSELHVEGLAGEERIVVCSTDGRIEISHQVEENEHVFVTPIVPGIHIVRIDDQSVIVMNNAK